MSACFGVGFFAMLFDGYNLVLSFAKLSGGGKFCCMLCCWMEVTLFD